MASGGGRHGVRGPHDRRGHGPTSGLTGGLTGGLISGLAGGLVKGPARGAAHPRAGSFHGAMPTPPRRAHARSCAAVSAGQWRAPGRGSTREAYSPGVNAASKKQPVP